MTCSSEPISQLIKMYASAIDVLHHTNI